MGTFPRSSVRVYLPATVRSLRVLAETGAVGTPPPIRAFAVTPTLREWYLDDDIEALEYAAFSEATHACLRLLAHDSAMVRRRVIISADIADTAVSPEPALGRGAVQIRSPVLLSDVVALHVDAEDAQPAVAAEFELEWYDISELESLLEIFDEH